MNFPMASIACFICTFVVGVFLGYSYKTGSITVNGRVYDRAADPKAFWGAMKSGLLLGVSTLAIGILIIFRQ